MGGPELLNFQPVEKKCAPIETPIDTNLAEDQTFLSQQACPRVGKLSLPGIGIILPEALKTFHHFSSKDLKVLPQIFPLFEL